jgi:hypothetical protein
MRRLPIGTWALLAFFFFGGIAFTIFDETRWIGIGQIWIVVALLVGVFQLGLHRRIAEKFRRSGGAPEA